MSSGAVCSSFKNNELTRAVWRVAEVLWVLRNVSSSHLNGSHPKASKLKCKKKTLTRSVNIWRVAKNRARDDKILLTPLIRLRRFETHDPVFRSTQITQRLWKVNIDSSLGQIDLINPKSLVQCLGAVRTSQQSNDSQHEHLPHKRWGGDEGGAKEKHLSPAAALDLSRVSHCCKMLWCS